MEKEFIIDETGNQLQFWNKDNEAGKLETVECDIITLLKIGDSLKSNLYETERENKKKLKSIFLKFLDVRDALERVLKKADSQEKDMDVKTKKLIDNFRAIYRMAELIIKEEGIVKISAPEGKAIPGFHTIIETEERPGLANDTIIEEIVIGYLWHNEILRKSEVIAVYNGD